MKNKNDRYELCDFCHKPHKASELEKVVITYKKCKSCSTDNISLDKNLAVTETKTAVSTISPAIASTPRRPAPPPYLANAFSPPSGFELGSKPPVAMPQTKLNKSKNVK